MRPMLSLPQKKSQTTPWAQAISTVGGAVGGFYRDGPGGIYSGAQEGLQIGTLAGGGIDAATGREQPQPTQRGQIMQPVSQGMSPGKTFNAFMDGVSAFTKIKDLAPDMGGGGSQGGSGSGAGAGNLTKDISSTSAMDRRYAELEGSPDYKLNRAAAALETAPPEIRQEYGPTLEAARKRLARQNGRGN